MSFNIITETKGKNYFKLFLGGFQMSDIYEEMCEKWPSAIVARTAIPVFTGGLVSEGYQANLDCLGIGPERIKTGRKVCYSTKVYTEWLKKRIEGGKQ